MASLCLPNSELHVGCDWHGSAALARAISDPARPAVLLYPSVDAIDVSRQPPQGPVTLVVVDGTWSQTKKMVRQNSELARLPRFAFEPDKPSEYRIRREPKPYCVSTIEALMFVLSALEGRPERFLGLLAPFRNMVDRQIEHKALRATLPSRHAKKEKPARLNIPVALRERKDDIVCVVGEANAWPWRSNERTNSYPDELVHWVAWRVATGESLECIVAPRNPLAPNTARYVALSAERLHAGISLHDLLSRWHKFVRERDILCSWGCYATALLASSGGTLPPLRFDLRALAKDLLKRNIGTMDRFLASLDESPRPCLAEGRAGVRLGQLMRIADCFSTSSLH